MIEFITANDCYILLRKKDIVSVEQEEDGCIITTEDGTTRYVADMYEDIKQKLV